MASIAREPAAGYVRIAGVEHDLDEELSAKGLRSNFWWMSVCFSLNHGCTTTPLVVASTLLGRDVASVGNGLLYVVTLLSSFFVAAPMVGSLGPKASLIAGMSLYCVYITGFALAATFQDCAAPLAWLCFCGGSVCGGLAAGVLWTAQGGYFASTATQLAELEGVPREAATAGLAGGFAFAYLAGEVGSKLGFSWLQRLEVEPWLIGLIYASLGALSVAAMARGRRMGSPSPTVNPLAKVWAVANLWSDPLIWLLAPTNFTFGFCAAFMNGFVNGHFARGELGPTVVGFLAAITAATAAVFARFFGLLSGWVGKGPIIVGGAGCFMGIALCLFGLHCCTGWGWWLISLYVLQGAGRAVYESTNRAMFSDFFTGPDTEGAFANCMLQSSAAFAVCYFLQTALTGCALAAIVLALSALTPLSYAGACVLHRRRLLRLAKEEPLSPDHRALAGA